MSDPYDYSYWLPVGAGNSTYNNPVVCECGTTITLGPDDDPQFHSDYCPVYKDWVSRGKPNATEKKK